MHTIAFRRLAALLCQLRSMLLSAAVCDVCGARQDEELDQAAFMARIQPARYEFIMPKDMPAMYKPPGNDEVTAEIRERVYVGAIGSLINGTLADAEDIPHPPSAMTHADCLLLRRAILGGSRLQTDDEATLQQHNQLFPLAKEAAAHVLDDLRQQVSGEFATRMSAMEKARAQFLLKSLTSSPPYAAKLTVQSVRGSSFRPKKGWPKGTNPELSVVIRPLGAGIDPEETVATSKPTLVNKFNGDVAWEGEEFAFDLECEPTLMQVQVQYRTSTLGSKTVAIKWMPEFKPEDIVISFRIEADEIKKMENIRGKVGRTKLGGKAGKAKIVAGGAAGKAKGLKSKANVKSLRMKETGDGEVIVKARKSQKVCVDMLKVRAARSFHSITRPPKPARCVVVWCTEIVRA